MQGRGKMNCSQTRRLATLALATLLLGWVNPSTRADEPVAQAKPEAAQAPAEQGDQEKPKEAKTNGSTGGGASGQQRPQFDPAVVSAGQSAFERSCVKCHDAAR